MFSGASPHAPRCPNTIGRGRSKYGWRTRVVIVRVMAVLTRDVLLAEIEKGALALDPLRSRPPSGPASIDLTLGDEIRVLAPGPDPIPIRDDADFRLYTRLAQLDAPYVLAPGDTIHGITRERITLSPSLCGLLEGRSRFARLGLMIHVTSAFVQPGVSNRQVLEMSNVSGHPLEIHAGRADLPARGAARGRLGRLPGPLRATGRALGVRAVVQRVREARICVGEETVAEMGEGLLALVGVAREDGPEDAAALAQKLVHLRVLADAEGRMNRSLLETGQTLGVVSQFTCSATPARAAGLRGRMRPRPSGPSRS